MRTSVRISRIAILLAILLYVSGIYANLTNEPRGEIYSIAVFFYTYMLHPLIFFFLGRKLVLTSTEETTPFTLIAVIFFLTFIPVTYLFVPTFFEGGFFEGAIGTVYVVFEFAALLATILVCIYFLRRRVKHIVNPRDLISIHHVLFGTLIYFYFIRLTLVTSIILSQIEV